MAMSSLLTLCLASSTVVASARCLDASSSMMLQMSNVLKAGKVSSHYAAVHW